MPSLPIIMAAWGDVTLQVGLFECPTSWPMGWHMQSGQGDPLPQSIQGDSEKPVSMKTMSTFHVLSKDNDHCRLDIYRP